MTREEKIEYIAQHYGTGKQTQQCVEEMAEFIQAACKVSRSKTDEELGKRGLNLLEELADVEIMVQQLKLLYLTSDKLKEVYDATMDEKLDRQLQRIKEEKGTC